MNKNYLFFFIIAIAAFSFFGIVSAQEATVNFPVEELGNCRNFKECANFCDKDENIEACAEFAETKGMMMPQEAKEAKKMLQVLKEGGPGGCKNKNQCESYCQDVDHINECVDFAEKNNFMSAGEVKEAKAVAAALKKGVSLPGNCKSKEDCDQYCESADHIDECVAFGKAAGLIKPEEARMLEKTKGRGPGGCIGKKQCESYCDNPDNMEQCMNFAFEHDLMPQEEKEQARKALEAIKKGIRPPPCRGREACDQYCSQPENSEQCINFAVAAGFIPPEEAEQALKMAKAGLMGGPGGCRGKDQCESYCDNPDNMEECVNFAEKAGFMSGEEAQMARKMSKGGPGGCKSKDDCENYCAAPEHNEECMNFALENGLMKPEEIERAKKFMQGGPGGCRGEECKTYCEDQSHQEECFNFAKENNLIPQEELEKMKKGREIMRQGGPGGCKSQQECETFCGDNSEECARWSRENGIIKRKEDHFDEKNRGGLENEMMPFNDGRDREAENMMERRKEMMSRETRERMMGGEERMRLEEKREMMSREEMFQNENLPEGGRENIMMPFVEPRDGQFQEFQERRLSPEEEERINIPLEGESAFPQPQEELLPRIEQQAPNQEMPFQQSIEQQQFVEPLPPVVEPAPSPESEPVPSDRGESAPVSSAMDSLLGAVFQPFINIFQERR